MSLCLHIIVSVLLSKITRFRCRLDDTIHWPFNHVMRLSWFYYMYFKPSLTCWYLLPLEHGLDVVWRGAVADGRRAAVESHLLEQRPRHQTRLHPRRPALTSASHLEKRNPLIVDCRHCIHVVAHKLKTVFNPHQLNIFYNAIRFIWVQWTR